MPSQNEPADDRNSLLPLEGESDEYEVITSEEVDRVLDALDALIESVNSDNIRVALEEAADSVYSLIYGEDDESCAEDDQSEAA